MEDVGKEFETSNQESNDGTSDIAVGDQQAVVVDQLAAFGNSGANFGFGGEENFNPNKETQSGRTPVPEHVMIRIHDSEEPKDVIISRSGWSPLKVPAPMSKVDTRDYIPMIVSIGPFYHNEPSPQAMQTQIRQFLDQLIQNQYTMPKNSEESLKKAMREMEKETRNFYEYDFQTIKSDEFVEMILLDGSFIVGLLHLYKENREKAPIFNTPWMRTNIPRDLLLLENQLPMSVLKKIFELTNPKGKPTLNTLALKFFEPLRPGKDKFEQGTLDKHANYECKHLLHLFYSTLISDKDHHQQPAKRGKEETHHMLSGKGWVQNAKTLSYAGIKFQKNSGSILDIQLKCKTLKIPTMVIDDSTSPLLRNLIAYEQNNCDAKLFFCCLALFLDSIMDTVEDVKILRDAKIIKHAMGTDAEVANLFNKLTKELVFDINKDYCYMTEQIEKINYLCRTHDIIVRIRRLLTRLNFYGLLNTCFSILITIFLIMMRSQPNYSNVDSSKTPYSPPPSSS